MTARLLAKEAQHALMFLFFLSSEYMAPTTPLSKGPPIMTGNRRLPKISFPASFKAMGPNTAGMISQYSLMMVLARDAGYLTGFSLKCCKKSPIRDSSLSAFIKISKKTIKAQSKNYIKVREGITALKGKTQEGGRSWTGCRILRVLTARS